MAKWSIDLEQYSHKQENKLLEIRRKFLFALYSRITFLNPVDTGRSRANWNVSENVPDGKTNNDARGLKYNSVAEMPNPQGDEPLFIANGLDYIEGLEYGRSKQAPNGMVGVTVAGANDILNEVIRGAK